MSGAYAALIISSEAAVWRTLLRRRIAVDDEAYSSPLMRNFDELRKPYWAIVAFNMEGVFGPSSIDAVLAEADTYYFERRTRQFR